MSIHSGVTSGTPEKILFGAGVYFRGVAYDEKVAPTEEEIRTNIFGATQDGGTLSITPEFFIPELDDVRVAVKELEQKIGEKAQMEVSFAELSPEHVKNTAIGKLGETTDAMYDVITSSERIMKGHYYDGFGFYGELIDGRPVIIIFKQAICTSGFTTDPKSKTNAIFKGTFECRSDIEYSTRKLPYAIFIRKTDGWTDVRIDEVNT